MVFDIYAPQVCGESRLKHRGFEVGFPCTASVYVTNHTKCTGVPARLDELHRIMVSEMIIHVHGATKCVRRTKLAPRIGTMMAMRTALHRTPACECSSLRT